MNRDQLRAYGLVTHAIAKHVFEQAKADDAGNRAGRPELRDAPWPIYYNYSASTFEAASDYLQRLKILDNIGTPVFFVFRIGLDDVATTAERNCAGGPTLEELIVVFIELYEYWGSSFWKFSIERGTPFGDSGGIVPVLDALATLGYLKRTDKGFIWTAFATKAMHAAGFWEDVGDPG